MGPELGVRCQMSEGWLPPGPDRDRVRLRPDDWYPRGPGASAFSLQLCLPSRLSSACDGVYALQQGKVTHPSDLLCQATFFKCFNV